MKLDRYKNHDIEVVIDKLIVTDKDDVRLKTVWLPRCSKVTAC